MEPPPQEAINRKVIAIKGTRRAAEYLRTNDVRVDDLRIDTSKYCRRARDSAAALDDRSKSMLCRSRGERNPETALFTGRGTQVRTAKARAWHSAWPCPTR